MVNFFLNRKRCLKILLWGSGSQSRLIHEMVKELSFGDVMFIIDPTAEAPSFKSNARWLSSTTELSKELNGISHFAVGIGDSNGFARQMTAQYLESLGLLPLTIIHPSSYVDPTAAIDPGCLIMPAAVIHKFASVGRNTVVNTNACIDHECQIGMGVHVMGCSAIAGRVKIENFATIGTNATILPDLTIGEGAYIAAGAVVTRNIPPHSVAVGVPARVVRTNSVQPPIGIDVM
jgi:sugar O-acyltransferase (sialic acid O-acetyltransferase NeuD family)